MKVPKYILPVGISLASFLWGYRGGLWLGEVKEVAPQAPVAAGTTAKTVDKFNPPSPKIEVATPPVESQTPSREMQMLDPSQDNDEVPHAEEEDIGGGEVVEEPEDDPELDQNSELISPDDDSEPEITEDDVDSEANEGDLEEDELETPPEKK